MSRRFVSVRLTDDAQRGYDRTTTEHNLTFTALLESLGRWLGEGHKLPAGVVDQARRIDRERRSRR